MIGVGAATRLSVMLFQFTFQGYRLNDGVKKGPQTKIIINPTSCVASDISIGVYQHPFSLYSGLTKTDV